MSKVRVSAAVYDGLEAIRQSGVVNMFDRPRVMELAEMWGHDETAAWVRVNRGQYARLLFHGVEVGEEDEPCAD